MGNSWGMLQWIGDPDRERKKYMKSPDFDDLEGTGKLVSELGGYEFAGIVSIGPVGVGKSSSLNTVASYLNNRLEQQAGCGTGTGSLTNVPQTHLISYQGRPVKWKWLDTPGDLFQGLVEAMKQVNLGQASGSVEENAGCNTREEYTELLEETLLQPMKIQQIGCVMAMISAAELRSSALRVTVGGHDMFTVPVESRLHANLLVIKDLYPRLVQRNLRMVIILTKVDLIDPSLDENVANVAFSRDVHVLRLCVSKATGVPLNQVHPLVNLVRDFDPMDNLELGQLALFNVRAALHAARHTETAPMRPSSATGSGCFWDTVTVPSGVESDDGSHGRSHCIGDLGTVDGGDRNAIRDLHLTSLDKSGSVSTDVNSSLINDHRSVSQPTSPNRTS